VDRLAPPLRPSEHPKGRGLLRVLVRVSVDPLSSAVEGLRVVDEGMAERAADSEGDLTAALQQLAERLVDDLVGELGGRLQLMRGSEAALLAALQTPPGALRDEAVSLAGERQLRSAVPQLLVLLDTAEGPLRDRLVGALASIGDPRAVRPLTEHVRFSDVVELTKTIDALARIGGRDAESYLQMVAAAHDRAEVRQVAERALVHLRARSAPSGAKDGGLAR
jgi:HEAT repeat protein